VLVRRHRELLLVIGRAHPRSANLDAPAAQGHRAVLVAVALGGALRVVLALRPNDLVDLELHQLMHDAEADADAQRQQPLPRRPDELAEGLLDSRWERTLDSFRTRNDLSARYLLHGGFLLSRMDFTRPERCQRQRTGQEDRRSKFYETRDNLRRCVRESGCQLSGSRG